MFRRIIYLRNYTKLFLRFIDLKFLNLLHRIIFIFLPSRSNSYFALILILIEEKLLFKTIFFLQNCVAQVSVTKSASAFIIQSFENLDEKLSSKSNCSNDA